ncbi:MAG: hypothetical protein J7L64_06705 [Acidobacteria bacterium]|nr:hypothetical protein [Acidobacteriota bacterium]
MARIPMVKCYVLKKGDDPSNRQVRYVPLKEFALWANHMENQHKFEIHDPQDSIWIDEDEHIRFNRIYTRLPLEPVNELILYVFFPASQLILPITRYFPKEEYEQIKKTFIAHYEKADDKAIREIEEKPGYWIKRE